MRGDRFADHPKDLSRFVDILCLTHPDKVTGIHAKYLEAGADIVETNSAWEISSRLKSRTWIWIAANSIFVS